MKISGSQRKQRRLPAPRVRPWLRFGGEDGSALIEMAALLPFMLLVLTGAGSFTLAFYNLQQIGNAVSAAAQGLGATAGVVDDPCAQVVSQVEASMPGTPASDLSFTVVITNAAGTATTYGPTAGSLSCKAAGSGGAASTAEAAGEPQTVTVAYSFKWFTVFTWKAFGNSSPSSALTSSETTLAD